MLHANCMILARDHFPLTVQQKQRILKIKFLVIFDRSRSPEVLNVIKMGNKSSLLLREEEIATIQEDTGCK